MVRDGCRGYYLHLDKVGSSFLHEVRSFLFLIDQLLQIFDFFNQNNMNNFGTEFYLTPYLRSDRLHEMLIKLLRISSFCPKTAK